MVNYVLRVPILCELAIQGYMYKNGDRIKCQIS